ncbi:MAG: hypothetical protein ACTHMC_11635 [Pseudobacter sp.]|uniref:hypothetical protein n=1 Tax=Pseudobacter sp. TaxID=2045420 RepID=UPI003F80165D
MYKIIAGLLLIMGMTGCAKDVAPKEGASLIVINAVTGSKPLATNFNGTGPVRFIDTRRVVYGQFMLSANVFERAGGTVLLGLYQFPDTLAKDKPLFDLQLDLPAGSMNSLYLSGTVDAPDTVLLRDQLPGFAPADTSMGLRFVNLSKGSNPVKVELVGSTTGPEVTGLAYKAVSLTKKYPILKKKGNYVFEFRDAVTNDLLVTYTATGIDDDGIPPRGLNRWVYRNFTLALIGKPGGTGADAQTALLIQN